MGGAVSAGANNDELIDKLLEADYIKSSDVERVFRAVDRGHYFTAEYKERAYRDLAWRCGNLHISAPCIYSRVMETLKLGPGMSFLNLGSGTGYLSTMAGLLLGSNGTNHGIEIHEDVIHYSKNKLDEFLSTSSAIDEYDFCEPKFICGNCLYLNGCGRQYDRVYCGAACPENYENYMKNLIKVGGILVMPINDQLLQICRTSDTNWESKSVLPVSFATLISGKISDCFDPLKMPDLDPLSLQDICRFAVRSILRRNIDIEHPELKHLPKKPRKRVKKRTFREFVLPIFNGNSDSEEEQDLQEAPTSVEESQQFLMDFSNDQTCRSIMGWSQFLQGTSAQLLGAIEAHCASDDDSQKKSSVEKQTKEVDTMEEDSNSDSVLSAGSSNEDILEEMSDEEFWSDIGELHKILTVGSINVGTGGCENRGNETNQSDGSIKENKSEVKSKREKLDRSRVDDLSTVKELNADNVNETDLHNCKKASCDLLSNNLSPPVQINNYTTYMKEKIKLLPLPMTLKYFLNLNREL